MTSDKDKASGGEPAGAAKRPSRTIELEADEVEFEDRSGESEGEPEQGGEDTDRTPGEATTADAESVESVDQPDEPDEPAAAGASDTEPENAPPRKPPPPPQRTKPFEVKAFFTHLAAGLAGGLIGVVGAGVGLGTLAPGVLSGAAPQKTAQIEQRLDALSAQLRDQQKSVAAAPGPDALAKLDSRLAALESKPAPDAAVPANVAERLTKLEDTLKALQSAAAGPGSTGLEQSAALNARIDAVADDLKKETAALREDIAETRRALADRPEASAAASPEAVKAVEQRLAALEEKTAALADQPVVAAPQPANNAAALTLAFESLRRTAERGESYATQLEALRKLAPAELAVPGLDAHAGSGVPSEAALLKDLPNALREARVAGERSDDKTFLDRLASSAGSVVRVRRIGPQQGGGAAAVLSRMEARMKADDLSGVMAEAESLAGAPRDELQPWLDQAKARRDLNAALAALEAKLLAGFAPGPSPGTGG